ncbi:MULTISPECIES: PTS sugar transporter subunit IIC [Tepidanaerobacter]|uniref:Permease IIC component n=1 Tax=Tepidanaerobacter syntrophicus TaxID=224999 RepID=A0A0U9HIZ9_9FIRM|nr:MULTISPECIES: PTS sugar transporter subunit IIC [Tepidanaerobacter]GAQ25876.1 PTS system, cellobiose-specific IIC component [Tepidanaerobacter syntrophicus]GLI50499.1 permease IIC component [Tepidanaerobacter syntrophicus]HHV82154.1 PTS sugar transporter subunit IIC [Tepidanaerobacter syntrophicus]
MDAIMNFLNDHFMPFAGRLAEQRHLKALREGIVAVMPLLLVGSLFLIIAYPPIEALDTAVAPFRGELSKVSNATFGILALVASFSVAYSLSNSYKLDSLASGIISVSAFLLSMPATDNGNIPAEWLGSKGLFVAMIIAILAVEIQRFFMEKNIFIKMPAEVPPFVARSFAALLPGFVALLLVWIVNIVLLTTTKLTLPEAINIVLGIPIMNLGSSLPATLVAIVVIQLLWCVGIQGADIVAVFLGPVWLSLSEQNAVAKAAGEMLPNIITNQFIYVFVFVGGAGATFALALLLLKAKSSQLKAIGKVGIWPAIFNINEPITFGMPIIMNPVMFIPFILAPLAAAITTYIAMATNLVARPYAIVPWTTPVFISGFLTTGDWKAIILQLVNIIIAAIIYYPFLRMWDKMKFDEETKQAMEEDV